MAKHVLIVDDDPDVRDATSMVLTGAGYAVSEASNSKEAEQVLRDRPVDLILLDIMMDVETEGFHFAYKVRRDEKLKDIPIIVLTCIEEKTGERIEPEKAGDYLPVQAFLRKPLDAGELTARIAELIG